MTYQVGDRVEFVEWVPVKDETLIQLKEAYPLLKPGCIGEVRGVEGSVAFIDWIGLDYHHQGLCLRFSEIKPNTFFVEEEEE